MPILRQTAYATMAKERSRTVTAVFNEPTLPGSLLIAVDAAAGTLPSNLHIHPHNFDKVDSGGRRDIQMQMWYWENADSVNWVSVRAEDDDKSQQLRIFEYIGMRQTDVLDKVEIRDGENDDPRTGETDETTQADELVLGVIVNQYASTSQYGFRGNLSRLYESVSPQRQGGEYNQDWERSRMTIHQAITTETDEFSLTCDLSTDRRWIGIVATFKGGTSGPVKFTAKQNQPPMIETGGRGVLTVFGPLTNKISSEINPFITTGLVKARIAPFNFQYRLGGWSGLLIGSDTNYHVQGTEGLYGWQVRTSDDDKPRGDGSLRGIDLEAARQVVFSMNVGKGRDEVERNLDELYRALVPQRDTDWELIWRRPTQPLKMMRVRPIDLMRSINRNQLQYSNQSFILRAADPRHYSAVAHTVEIPVTPAGQRDPIRTQVTNIGNSAAFPIISIQGPEFGEPVTRVELVNETALVSFEAALILPNGSTLVGDMDARITGVPRSIITLDGQSKYGAWQLPRDPFRIDPDPTGFGGFNEIYLRTIPEGAPIRCTLEYRDTWAG